MKYKDFESWKARLYEYSRELEINWVEGNGDAYKDYYDEGESPEYALQEDLSYGND